MEIYLMQHGEAVPEAEDPERPLSRKGVEQVRRTAGMLRRLGIAPRTLLCSPKKRSRQSAALIAEIINYPYSDIVRSEAVKAGAKPSETLDFLQGLEHGGSVLIAGHLPSLARFAALLLGGDEDAVRLRFDNGGLCRIDSDALTPGEGELAFLLPAVQMERLA